MLPKLSRFGSHGWGPPMLTSRLPPTPSYTMHNSDRRHSAFDMADVGLSQLLTRHVSRGCPQHLKRPFTAMSLSLTRSAGINT
jgi:hypothetical protein